MKNSHTTDNTNENISVMEEETLCNTSEKDTDQNRLETLLYQVLDIPPIHISIFFAFQQVLVSLSGSLAVSTFVADAGCASEFPDLKTTLLSSTLFMNGVTTLLMVTLGVRLPVFQGAASMYVITLLALQRIDNNYCYSNEIGSHNLLNQNLTFENISTEIKGETNESDFTIMHIKRRIAIGKLQEYQGSLIVAGIVHFLVGATGTVGFLMKFIGPVTIVPTILVGGIFLSKAAAKFARTHWGISSVTAVTSVILSLYLGDKKMPCPVWSRKRGFHVYWYPLHRVFSILIGMLVGWLMSAVMTHAGVLSDDPSAAEFLARTDARSGIIQQANLFQVPYPNQFGAPSFNVTVFVAFLIGTIVSILDSIGDYYACAKICNLPPPPTHAINRGIAVEGLCSVVSGAIGCGHATSTNGGNIGALGLTRVTSRSVFLWVAGIYIVFGIVGKISAIFITMPYPVLGGAMMVMYGMFNGIVLSNLEFISLKSTRNLAIIGIGILVGIMFPSWMEKYPEDINTGNPHYDSVLKTFLTNPNLCCGVITCILDNTVPGTLDERGILAWLQPDKESPKARHSGGLKEYSPLLPTKFLSFSIMKYIPLFPYEPRKHDSIKHKTDG